MTSPISATSATWPSTATQANALPSAGNTAQPTAQAASGVSASATRPHHVGGHHHHAAASTTSSTSAAATTEQTTDSATLLEDASSLDTYL